MQQKLAGAMPDPGADEMLGDLGLILVAQQVVDRVGDFRCGLDQRAVEVEHHEIEHALAHLGRLLGHQVACSTDFATATACSAVTLKCW